MKQAVRAGLLVLALVGCGSQATIDVSASDIDEPTTTTRVPPEDLAFVIDDLPSDFEKRPLFLCVASTGTFVGYVGEGEREGTEFDDVYEGSGFLRLSVWLGDEPGWLDRLSGRSDPSDDQPIELGDGDATLFTVSTAEPVRFPWPAVGWRLGDIRFQIIGEGMNESEVIAAAESVRAATDEERALGGLFDTECES